MHFQLNVWNVKTCLIYQNIECLGQKINKPDHKRQNAQVNSRLNKQIILKTKVFCWWNMSWMVLLHNAYNTLTKIISTRMKLFHQVAIGIIWCYPFLHIIIFDEYTVEHLRSSLTWPYSKLDLTPSKFGSSSKYDRKIIGHLKKIMCYMHLHYKHNAWSLELIIDAPYRYRKECKWSIH